MTPFNDARRCLETPRSTDARHNADAHATYLFFREIVYPLLIYYLALKGRQIRAADISASPSSFLLVHFFIQGEIFSDVPNACGVRWGSQ
jgi:hypothetical protein